MFRVALKRKNDVVDPSPAGSQPPASTSATSDGDDDSVDNSHHTSTSHQNTPALDNTIRSSSPFHDSTMSTSGFCEPFKLGGRVAQMLDELDFTPSDNLSEVKTAEWSQVGFKTLSWGRVMKANKRLRKELVG